MGHRLDELDGIREAKETSSGKCPQFWMFKQPDSAQDGVAHAKPYVSKPSFNKFLCPTLPEKKA